MHCEPTLQQQMISHLYLSLCRNYLHSMARSANNFMFTFTPVQIKCFPGETNLEKGTGRYILNFTPLHLSINQEVGGPKVTSSRTGRCADADTERITSVCCCGGNDRAVHTFLRRKARRVFCFIKTKETGWHFPYFI